jgi:hypothetical protein
VTRRSSGLPGLFIALGAVTALLVLVALASLIGHLLIGSNGNAPVADGPEVPTGSPASPAPGSAVTAVAPTLMGASGVPLPIVALQAADRDRSIRADMVDRLREDAVVHVLVAGFEPFEAGFVEQCVTALGRLKTCLGRFPVQAGEDGGVDVQYLLNTSSVPGACVYGRETCTLEVVGNASSRWGQAQLIVGEFHPGQILVRPRLRLRDGQNVEVAVTGFPADTSATALLCAPLGSYDVRHCDPNSASEFRLDLEGRGATQLTVRTGSLGIAGTGCGPRDDCGVQVVTSAGFVAAPMVPLQFSLGPGASYNGARLAVGLGVAVLLLLLAVIVVRRTDWTKPSEAATPDVDAADLETDKSLDELFGTDEELEVRDPLPF